MRVVVSLAAGRREPGSRCPPSLTALCTKILLRVVLQRANLLVGEAHDGKQDALEGAMERRVRFVETELPMPQQLLPPRTWKRKGVAAFIPAPVQHEAMSTAEPR